MLSKADVLMYVEILALGHRKLNVVKVRCEQMWRSNTCKVACSQICRQGLQWVCGCTYMAVVLRPENALASMLVIGLSARILVGMETKVNE